MHLRASRPARVSWMHHGHAIRSHICSRSRSHFFSRLYARLSASGAFANRYGKPCMECPLRDDPAAAQHAGDPDRRPRDPDRAPRRHAHPFAHTRAGSPPGWCDRGSPWKCTTPCESACQACERAITPLFDPERSLRNARTNSSSCEADIAASMGCTRWVANDARNDPLTSRMLNASASSGHLATQLLLRSEKSGKLTGKIVTGAHATVCTRRAYSGHALANQQAIAAGMTGIQGD